jgi:dTMP kinase
MEHRQARIPGGVLVAVEGIDGAGKTTQARALEAGLHRDVHPVPVVSSKEPTNGPWGQKIRASATTGRMAPAEELEAFILDRQQHVAEVIAPTLAAGGVVILDRYYFSTAAYQGARGLDAAQILARNEEFAPRPDLLVILDLAPEVALTRVGTREEGANLFEQLGPLATSRALFLALEHPRKLVLDGELAPEVIAERILEAVKVVAAEKILARAREAVAAAGEDPSSAAESLRAALVAG